MKYALVVENPDDVEVSITFTMSLGDWKYVRRDTSFNSIPAAKVRNTIDAAIEQVSMRLEGKVGGAE